MSEESISYGEDKENLLYISKKINVDEFGLGEDGLFRESISTIESDISSKPVGSEIEILENIKDSSFSANEVLYKLKPFHLRWSYGINAPVGVINLTNESKKELFFASIHVAVLYDYCSKEMRHMEGHQARINCISADNSGDWLATSDGDNDGCLIVWNSKTMTPVFTLFSIYPESGILIMAMSPSAKYLITIGEKDDTYYQVDFWLWTLGEEKSTDVYLVHKTNGSPVKICYNPDVEEQIMLVFKNQVFLLNWDTTLNKMCCPCIPQIVSKVKIGELTCGTYIHQGHESYVTTTRGCILVFRPTLYTRSYEEGEKNNTKIFINAVKVTPVPIGEITTTDGKLVIGDSRGHILFFDKRIKILYWLRNFSLGSITAISFAKIARTYQYQDSKILIKKRPLDDDNFVVSECEYVDMEEEITSLMAIDAPFDATLNNNAFIVRDFFLSTSECNVYAVNFLHNTCTALFQIADANISAMDTHDEQPYIVIGYENGRIALINFEKKETIASYVLPPTDKTEEDGGDIISCIKYSYESLHLVCGRNNGEVWILEPVMLTPKVETPFRNTKNKIVKIDFSHNSLQFAYFDVNRTVLLYNYSPEKGCWEFQGKVRAHYESINDLKFVTAHDPNKSVLYTIGMDRHLVEYNNLKVNEEEELFNVTSRERIDQSAIPMNFTFFERTFNKKSIAYFLIADNKHKLKLLHAATKVPRSVVLGPAYGCFKDAPIKKMIILPSKRNVMRYMIFMCKKRLGIQIMTPDGNPYRYTGYLAHPIEIADCVMSYDGTYVFTFGTEGRCIFQWEIKTRTVELLNAMGGTELEPFYSLLEGGKNGWLFHEIQDLFFYMQILQQENIDLPRRVSDTIGISEIPDLVRTCGYYPSDFELETMMIDIRYREFDETAHVRDEITFVEFVKLFLNHRPAYGNNIERIRKDFNTVCSMADYPRRGKIENHEFVYLFQTVGEPSPTLHKNLTTLLRISTYGENNFEFLPQDIDANFLLYELFGIDPDRTEDEDYERVNKENDSD